MKTERYKRQTSFFGVDGQEKLEAILVAIVGIGGLGTHVIQQLAYLGVRDFYLIDDEKIDATNLNRYVGARHDDVGKKKTLVGERIVKEINPLASVTTIQNSLQSPEAFDAITSSDCVFGCLDNDGARVILNHCCSAYKRPYFDLATEIFPDGTDSYGGRVCISVDLEGCLDCYDVIDREAATMDLESPEARKDREDLYGLNKDDFQQTGPSVVSINGIIASLAVTEFLVWATGLRDPQKLLTYMGKQGIVTFSTQRTNPDCYFCYELRGKRDKSGVQKYIQ